MRHLEPQQIESSPKLLPRRYPVLWVAGFVIATMGLGWFASSHFGTSRLDVVTQAEVSQRAVLLNGISPLQVRHVPADSVEKALSTMGLDAPAQQQLRQLLATAPAPSAAGLSTGNAVPVQMQMTSPERVRLIEISLWDSHSPDGDTVVVSSAGYVRQVVLTKQPQVLTVPVAGAAILITGVHDGGGGITLGVRGAQSELLMPIMSEGQTISLPVAP